MQSEARHEVVVTDVKMPFWSMVAFMIKCSFTAIPAVIILSLIWSMIWGLVMGLFGAV